MSTNEPFMRFILYLCNTTRDLRHTDPPRVGSAERARSSAAPHSARLDRAYGRHQPRSPCVHPRGIYCPFRATPFRPIARTNHGLSPPGTRWPGLRRLHSPGSASVAELTGELRHQHLVHDLLPRAHPCLSCLRSALGPIRFSPSGHPASPPRAPARLRSPGGRPAAITPDAQTDGCQSKRIFCL